MLSNCSWLLQTSFEDFKPIRDIFVFSNAKSKKIRQLPGLDDFLSSAYFLSFFFPGKKIGGFKTDSDLLNFPQVLKSPPNFVKKIRFEIKKEMRFVWYKF